MKKATNWNWLWLGFALGLGIFLWVQPAKADDGHGHNHHNDDGGSATASADSVLDNVIKDDSLSLGLAFSYGMGDVDINEGQNCMGSEQKANIFAGKQKLALNSWCAALFYELNGKHMRAAAMRCSIPTIRDTHPYNGDTAACIKGEDLSPPIVDEAETINLYDEQRSQDHEISTVQMAQVSFEQRITALEKKPPPRPVVVPAPTQEKETFDENRVAAMWAALDGDEDE